MSYDSILILVVLTSMVGLFFWGRWRHDVVAFGALLVCVLTGLVPVETAFTGFGHPAVITVACVLILSHGLQTTGAVESLARYILPRNAAPFWTMAALVGVGAVLSAFINNVGAMALLMPMAFLMAVAIGASCAFLTPIGHQNNTLILGPGGFRFGDYWRLGLPMEVLVVVVGIPVLLYVWPL